MPTLTTTIPATENVSLQKTVQTRLDNLTKPQGSLGRLEEFVMRFCLCRGSADASIKKKTLMVFAGDHGITAEGVASFPTEVTAQMVHNMLSGGAAVTVMCNKAGVDYHVVDMGVIAQFNHHHLLLDYKVAKGTKSFLNAVAMTKEQCTAAVEAGLAIAQTLECDIAAVGEMGIGNTSAASALLALLLDKSAVSTVGKGAGADAQLLERKQRIIAEAVRFHREQWDGSPMDALRRVGGYEIAGMMGFILGCAQRRIPVVVDGFITTSSALCAVKMVPVVKEYLFFGHASDEHFHRTILRELQVRPILELDMRLGEGTGAVLAMQIIEQALHCYHTMATFTSAGVSNRDS